MSKTLLITDDALIIREMIKEAAEKDGWDVVGQATNGQEAIELYTQLRPNAMTLDMVMPKYDGLHALRGIKEVDPNAKILVVSALDQKAVLKDAVQQGASDFVIKPFDEKRLLGALSNFVKDEKETQAKGPT